MSHEELDESLDLILDSLPEEHEGANRRKHCLTKSDAELIAKMIRVAMHNQGCSIGITQQQAVALAEIPAGNFRAMNDMVRERRKILSAIGLITVSALGWLGTTLFNAVPWRKLWEWVKTL